MNQRHSSVKVFPSHLKTIDKKFEKMALNCRSAEREQKEAKEGVSHMSNIQTLVKDEEIPTILNLANSSGYSSAQRSAMKPQKILIHKNL